MIRSGIISLVFLKDMALFSPKENDNESIKDNRKHDWWHSLVCGAASRRLCIERDYAALVTIVDAQESLPCPQAFFR